MLRIVAIGTREFTIGFRSTGVQGHEVKNAKEAKELIAKLSEGEETGIILIGESMAADIIDYIEDVSSTKTIPSILVLRDERSDVGIGKNSIQRYIEQATGMSSMAGE